MANQRRYIVSLISSWVEAAHTLRKVSEAFDSFRKDYYHVLDRVLMTPALFGSKLCKTYINSLSDCLAGYKQ